MILASEGTRALALHEFLLAAVFGIAPLLVTLWVKLALDRRRRAEDSEEALSTPNS